MNYELRISKMGKTMNNGEIILSSYHLIILSSIPPLLNNQ